jgi:hypothetical protein
MITRVKWSRVRRGRPCPICGKPDWCLIAPDEGAAICARIKSPNRRGEAGWLHLLRENPWRSSYRYVRSIPVEPPISIDQNFAAMATEYQRAVNADQLQRLAGSLGLSRDSLLSLDIGWFAQDRVWSFPMVDAQCNVLGIRLRRLNGKKFCVSGSKEGLFIPKQSEDIGSPLLICEGPTDAAALLIMGFRNVVGRPSCRGGVKLLRDLVRLRNRPDVVIVADADEPGQIGAKTLASILVLYAPAVRIITPPNQIKDARAWLQAGGTHQDIQQAIDKAPVRRVLLDGRNAAGSKDGDQ